MKRLTVLIISSIMLGNLVLTGCTGIPFTKNSYYDDYAFGMRWFKRGKYDKALKYWQPLVEKDDCDAEFWVGYLYFTGSGVPQDETKAVSLWQKAADANHPKAQIVLGDLYYQSDNSQIIQRCQECNFDKDLTKAYVWYMLAHSSSRYSGEKDYTESILVRIKPEMSDDEVAEGDAIISGWQPTPKDCEPRKWW